MTTLPSKPKTLTIRVVKTFWGAQTPHSTVFEAAIQSTAVKKRKKDKTLKFLGYLPSFSPGIEYTIVAQESEDRTIHKIVMITSWKRLCWWLTEDFLGPALEDHWRPEELNMFADGFRIPRSCEKDLEFLKDAKHHAIFLRNHFAPNVFFDLATLPDLENKDKNLYSSYDLEKNFHEVMDWQPRLDSNILSAVLLNPPLLPRLKWPHMEKLLDLARARLAFGTLTEGDREYETKLIKKNEIDLLLVNKKTKGNLERLIHPKKPSHDYAPVPGTYGYVYTFAETLKSRLKFVGDTSFTFHVPNKDVKDLINEHGILYEIEENQWTLPKHVRNSSIINNALAHLYKKPEEVVHPRTLEEALNLPICLITTNGHNVFEVFRRLIDKIEEGKIDFICPNIDTANRFFNETDYMAQPLGSRIFKSKTVVFCFSNQFTFRGLAEYLKGWSRSNPENCPERILFFGDPMMIGIHGVGCPFVEMLETMRLPIFEVVWQSAESQVIYSRDIQTFLTSLDSLTLAKNVPWAEGVQLCAQENTKKLYEELLRSPNADDYHMLCDSHQDLFALEKVLRSKPPVGLHTGDKVWVPERKCMDWIYMTTPLCDKGTTNDTPPNVCMTNKINHNVVLFNDKFSDHKKCCDLGLAGEKV